MSKFELFVIVPECVIAQSLVRLRLLIAYSKYQDRPKMYRRLLH